MYKKIIAVKLALAVALSLAACGNTKQIDGVTYDVYGFFNAAEKRNPAIDYEVSAGSVFWAIVFSESIIIPLYIVGYDLFQPVGKLPTIKGEVVR